MPRSFVITALLCLVLAVTLNSCGRFLKPHRISIQQGNIVTPSMLNQLELGMSKRQVEYVLGTPLIVDTFSPDSWHYPYSFELGTGERLERSLHLSFSEDQLVDIQTNIPSLKDQPASEGTDNEAPETQLIENEQKKLDKTLPTKIEDSQRDAGL